MTEEKNLKNFKRLEHERPEDAKANSVMNLEVTVDTEQQKLDRPLKDFTGMAQAIPKLIKPEAQIVLQCLFSAFEKEKTVKEGLLKDWIFGFAVGGVPAQCTVVGVDELIKQGFVTLEGPDGTPASIENEAAIECFIRYKPKLLDLIGESGEAGTDELKKTNDLLDDVGMNVEVPDEGASLK